MSQRLSSLMSKRVGDAVAALHGSEPLSKPARESIAQLIEDLVQVWVYAADMTDVVQEEVDAMLAALQRVIEGR